MIAPPIQNVISIPDLSPRDLYKQSDMVFYGQVISKQAGPSSNYYQIKVITYYKNQQTSDSITAAEHKPQGGHMTYPQFETGDKAIFYITKIDGINTISPYSQKAGEACDVHSFLGPEYFGPPPLYRGGYESNPRLLDVNGNTIVGMVLKNQEVVLSYDDVWNTYPEERTIPVKISIQNEDNGHYVFNMTQNLQVPACSFAGDLKWNFVPTEIGKHVAKIDIDNKTKIGYGFSVMFDATSKLQTFPSPLKQLKSGIKAENVQCNKGFLLAVKIDHAPACITESSAVKLFLRGWTYGFRDYQPMYFVKSGISAQIFVKYNLVDPNNVFTEPFRLHPVVYSQDSRITNNVNITAHPDMISHNTDTVVNYIINIQNNTKGVYWLSLDNSCSLIPLVSGIDPSNVTNTDIQNPATAWRCPISFIHYKIVDVSNISVKMIRE